MADQRLVDYIKHALKQGISINQVEKALIKEGWSKWDVDSAIDVIVEEKERNQFMNEPYAMQKSSRVHTTQIPGTTESTASPDQNYPEQGGKEELIVDAKKTEPVKTRPLLKDKGKNKPATLKTRQGSMGVFTKFKMILTHPGKFFQAVKDEKGYEAPVKYYLFLLFIQIIIANAVLFISMTLGAAFFDPSLISPLMGMFTLSTIDNFISANISLVMSVIVLFITAGFYSIFIKLFKGKGGVLGTFKGIVYGYTPYAILTVISIPIYLLIASSIIPADISGGINPLSDMMQFSFSSIMLPVIILSIISLVFFIWSLYLQLKGLSVFHEISMWRVLGALIISVLILVVIVTFILSMILMLFMLTMFNPSTMVT